MRDAAAVAPGVYLVAAGIAVVGDDATAVVAAAFAIVAAVAQGEDAAGAEVPIVAVEEEAVDDFVAERSESMSAAVLEVVALPTAVVDAQLLHVDAVAPPLAVPLHAFYVLLVASVAARLLVVQHIVAVAQPLVAQPCASGVLLRLPFVDDVLPLLVYGGLLLRQFSFCALLPPVYGVLPPRLVFSDHLRLVYDVLLPHVFYVLLPLFSVFQQPRTLAFA